MLDREPFLKAIFAAPADDLPRLVFADWLDEHGDPSWAEIIRVSCELVRLPLSEKARRATLFGRLDQLRGVIPADPTEIPDWSARGFRVNAAIRVGIGLLADPDEFRLIACRDYPEWYGANVLTVTEGPIVSREPLVTILTSPVTEYVTDLDLSGREEQVEKALPDPDEEFEFQLLDFTRLPTIHPRMVDELAGMRECRRLTALDLRNNDLDNMALNALAESPYFTRLKLLRLSEGNRFRGRVWQRVLERFGDSVE